MSSNALLSEERGGFVKRHVRLLHREALEEPLMDDVQELLLFGEVREGLRGGLDGEVEGIERPQEVVAPEMPVGNGGDDFLNIGGDDIALAEVFDVENLPQDALDRKSVV